jgi:hypothetical protein
MACGRLYVHRQKYPLAALQRAAEVVEQVGGVLDADRDADQRLGDAYAGAALGAHLVEDGVGHRDDQRARVTQVAGGDDQLQAVEEVEAVDAARQLEARQRTVLTYRNKILRYSPLSDQPSSNKKFITIT